MLEKVTAFIEKHLTPLAIRVSTINWLSAISEGVMTTFPLLMVGSISTVITSFPNEAYKAWLAATPLQHICSAASSLTTGIMGLAAAVAIAYSMSNKIKTDPLTNSILTIVAFLILQGFTAGNVATAYLGSQGLFVAMFLGVMVPQISKFLIDKGFYIRMPDGVPPMVERTFAALVPGIVVVFGAAVIEYLFGLTEYGNFIAWFYKIAQKPFTHVGTTLPSILILVVVGNLVNFLGIHNGFVTNMWVPLLYAASEENIAALAAGTALPNIISDPFRSYLFMGGTGALLGLELVMLLFCRSERIKQVSRISALPSLFNINEPILFGLPIMMNPIMMIPFVLAPFANAVLAYIAHASGLVPVLNGAIISWAMPTFLRIFLAGGGLQGILLVAVMLVMDSAIYFPFVRVVDRQYLAEESSQ